MENDEKKTEALIDKLLANKAIEHTSLDFTDNVMSKIGAISTATVYKPLIPKPIWFIIIGSFLVLVGYIYIKEPLTSSGWLDRFNLSNISMNPLQKVSFAFSKTVMYAMVFLAITVSIQIPLLKYYFNKRMAF
jgi:hypothetical protein